MRRGGTERFTDEEMLDVLRAAADDVAPTKLNTSTYIEWRKQQPDRQRFPARNQFARRFGGWGKAVELSGISSAGEYSPERDQTNDQLREGLLLVAEAIYPKALSRREYDDWCYANPEFGLQLSQTLGARLGGWEKAVGSIGAVPARRSYNKQQITDFLREAACEMQTPTVSKSIYERWRRLEPEPRTRPSITHIRAAAGSWGQAIREAGLEFGGTRWAEVWTDEELQEALRLATDHFGHPPTLNQYEDWRSTSTTPVPAGRSILRRFGRWTVALRLIGCRNLRRTNFEPQQGRSIRNLEAAIECFGYGGLTQEEYTYWRSWQEPDGPATPPSASFIKDQFHSWADALIAAGGIPSQSQTRTQSHRSISRQEIREAERGPLRKINEPEASSKPLAIMSLRSASTPGTSLTLDHYASWHETYGVNVGAADIETILNLFVSWEAACVAADVGLSRVP